VKTFKIGLIRVLTTDDRELLNRHGKILQENFPFFEVESRCIPEQYTGVHSEETHLKAVPKVVDLAVEMEKEGKDGIIISCAGDPGLEEARQKLRIPVVGAGASAASIALGCSRRVGVLNLTESTPEGMKQILGKHLVAEETVDAENTLELMTLEGMESAVRSSFKLKSSGAEVIALACTGMSTIGAAARIKERIGIHVIDPVIAEGMVMWSLLRF
jgi:Asp/Glu/hydantoin racemase